MLFETCYLEEVKKAHSLSVAPEPLAISNKKLEGLESELFKGLKTSPIASTGSWHVLW